MKTEKIILSFIAALFGLFAAFVVYYFYQSSKVVPKENQTLGAAIKVSPSPTPDKTFFLNVTSPADESVTDNKTVQLSGKTSPSSTVVVITPTDQQVVSPTQNGDFSVSTTIGDGANFVEITAIAPDGEEKKILRTVTYSTENF